MIRPVVIGIGNLFRHDDGVGAVVSEQARRVLPPTVRVVELDGEPARLVDAWADRDLVIIVDAARSGAPAGTVRRVEVVPSSAATTGRWGDHTSRRKGCWPASTHGYTLADAVGLGRACGRLPARLVVYSVEGVDFTGGPGLSDPVARAVPAVVDRLREECLAVGTTLRGWGAG